MRGVRLAVMALPLLGLSATSLPVAYAAMFSLFQPYDDEGYLLLSLKGTLEGHALYDEVFSQYGPFYYLFNSTLFRVLGLELGHDAGRLITLSLWVLATLLGGLAVLLLTRSLLLAIGAQLLFFGAFSTVVNEPMHPGALLGLLLAFIVLVVLTMAPRRPNIAATVLGALAASAALVKINIGVLAFISLGSALILSSRFRVASRAVKVTAIVALAGAPFAIMARDLDGAWALSYALLVGLSALAVALVAFRSEGEEYEGPPLLIRLAGGAIGTVVAVAVVTVVTGTGVVALVVGALLRPLRQAEAFTLPLPVPGWAVLGGVAGVAAAIVTIVWQGRRPTSLGISLSALARIGAGVVIWISVATVGRVPGAPLSLGLPLLWVATLPPRGDPAGIRPSVRASVCLLAVLQALHAYPVAGSQMAWSGALLIPVGSICIIDGWRLIVTGHDGRAFKRLLQGALVRLPVVGFLAWFVAASVIPINRIVLDSFRSGEPLRLPEAERLRIDPHQAMVLGELVHNLQLQCDNLFTFPGLNSLYLFTRIEPVTYLAPTAWMYLLTPDEQRRILGEVERAPGMCIVKNDDVAGFWRQGRPTLSGPLISYMDSSFVHHSSYEGYEILVPVLADP